MPTNDPSPTLTDLPELWRNRANSLRPYSEPCAHAFDVAREELLAAAEPFLRTLSLEEARLKSGASLRWLTAKAINEWGPAGMAEQVKGRWRIRECIVPTRRAEDRRRR